MNEFEIKVLKQALKHLLIKNIYKVSKEHNKKEYGRNLMPLIVEFTYKNEDFLIPFNIKDLQNDKMQNIKTQIDNYVESIERQIYDGEEKHMQVEIMDIVSDQIEYWFLKKEIILPQLKYEELVDRTRIAAKKLFEEGKRGVGLYKESMKYWANLEGINEWIWNKSAKKIYKADRY